MVHLITTLARVVLLGRGHKIYIGKYIVSMIYLFFPLRGVDKTN